MTSLLPRRASAIPVCLTLPCDHPHPALVVLLPKIEGAVRALKGGTAQALIIDGRIPHALRLTLRAPHHVGTEIVL